MHGVIGNAVLGRIRPLVPWLLAAIVSALSLLVLVQLDAVETERRKEEQRGQVRDQLSTIRTKLENALTAPLLRTRGMLAQIVAHNGITPEEFEAVATVLLDGHRNVRNMALTRDMVVAMTYPLVGNEKVIGIDYRNMPVHFALIQKAIETRTPVLQGPLPLIQGGMGLISRQAIFLKDGSFFGTVNVVLDILPIFQEAGLDDDSLPIRIAIRGRDGLGAQGEMIHGDPATFTQHPVETDVILPQGTWRLAAISKEAWGAADSRTTGTRLMGAGLFLLMSITAFGTALHVTRRAKVETALRRSQQGLAAAQHLARLGNWDLNATTGEMVWSDEVFSLLGLDRNPAAATWDNFLQVTHSEDRDHVRIAARTQGSFEHRIVRPSDRETRWVLERWEHRPDGTSTGTIQDVTEQKLAEQGLRTKTLELERSNADLERFAYIASHDLQTPLRNIISYSQLLERRYRGQLDQDANDFIDFIVEGTMRMSSLIRDLLNYARVSNQDQPLVAVDANQSLGEALANLETDLKESGGDVAADALPVVLADPALLVSLFQNLVGNAIHYRAPNRAPRIRVSCARTEANWLFKVVDNGIGIEPEYFDQIFVIFQRLHPPGDNSGTGVGLAMCQRIVRRFGGDIWVESVPGEGATFCFTLPAEAISIGRD